MKRRAIAVARHVVAMVAASALDQILAAQQLKTTTLYVTSILDQEDMHCGINTTEATQLKDS